MSSERAGDGAMRRATIEVTYDPHGVAKIDWAYHLRMGDLDAAEVVVLSDELDAAGERHQPIPQVGSNLCVCGQPVDDRLTHSVVARG